MADIFKTLKNELPGYINQIKNSNSEAKIIHEFTSFIQKVFDISTKEIDFEVSVKSSVRQVSGRMAAVFGNIILEFKKNLKKDLSTAEEEIEKYFQSLFEKNPKERHLGIATDGLFFRIYQPKIENNVISKLEVINEINLETSNVTAIFNWFDSYFFASIKIAPTSEHLKQSFGFNSPTYAVIRQELLALFDKVKNERKIKTKYENWERYLEIVYGDKPNEINLFIAHTYLSTFAKLLVYLKLSNKNQFRNYDAPPILYGNVFSNYGIINFVEEDLFTWVMYPTIKRKSSDIFEMLLRNLEIYDLELIDEDVLKELYQDMIHPTVRKQLGEFYTPDWLAEKMISDVFQKNPRQSMLDPSCGSGTFLFKTISYKIKNLSKQGISKEEILNHVIENVIGFDIHPLAALISKTNYLLALQDILHSRKGPITIPVYLSDSLKLPTKKIEVTNSIVSFEFNTQVKNKKFMFPLSIVDDMVKMDDVIEKMKVHGHELEEHIEDIKNSSYKIDINETARNLVTSFEKSINIKNEDERQILLDNIRVLFDMIIEESDSIWPYVLRNMYKPVALSYNKVDLIIGNPPWLTLRGMKDENYQNYLKELSKFYELVDSKKIQNIPHIELAALFFCKCVDQYLKNDGIIAFVMPKGILVASQHENFLKMKKPSTKLLKVFDLEKVEPLFRISSCVLIAKKGGITTYPVECIELVGKLESTNEKNSEAEKKLKTIIKKYAPVERKSKSSYYYDKFFQGATIVPRNFFFVAPTKESMLGMNIKTPLVRSDERNETKPPWDKIIFEKQVEANFLFATLLGNDIIPFGNRSFRIVVLPIILVKGIPQIVSNFVELQHNGFNYAGSYFKEAESKWLANATAKSQKMTIYQRLNFKRGITNQNLNNKYKVLYVASSTYLASTIIDVSQIFHYDDNMKISNGFIAESKTYYFETSNENEAHYLCAILNSKTIDDFIKPLQSRGLWGPRDIHKLPLSFPIPKFNVENPSHLRLAKLGKKCYDKVNEIIPKLKPSGVGKLRSEIRNLLKNELKEVAELVEKMGHSKN